jgi:hypothetical protein
MTRQIEQIDILLPLSIGACTVLCTILIHALALGATVNFFRYENRLGRPGAGVFVDLAIAVLVISFAFAAHLLAIGRWLGPVEAASGALMFGVSTAMVFAVTQRLILARYEDLRN